MRRSAGAVLIFVVGSLFFAPTQASAAAGGCGGREDEFGFAVASGDFDGDGFDDVAVGVRFENVGVADEGAVQIIYGTAGCLSRAGDQVFHQDTPGMNDTAEDFDNFGRALVGSIDPD
ncbi:MAG: hypothetical protein ACRDH5_01840 [bacterium]